MSNILHKFFKVLLPMLVLSLSLSGCPWDKEEKEKVKLKMGTSADYPPFESYKDGQIVGFDIEVAKSIAAKLNYELEIIDMDMAGLIPALTSKQIDFAMSALTITDKRKENVDMSLPYYTTNEVVLLYMPSKFSKETIVDYPNRTIGVQQGSAFEDIITEKQSQHPTLKVKSLPKIPMLVEELKIGHIDAIILDKKVATDIVSNIGDTLGIIEIEVPATSFGVAFPKDSELTTKFNKMITHMTVSGELNELKRQWIERRLIK